MYRAWRNVKQVRASKWRERHTARWFRYYARSYSQSLEPRRQESHRPFLGTFSCHLRRSWTLSVQRRSFCSAGPPAACPAPERPTKTAPMRIQDVARLRGLWWRMLSMCPSRSSRPPMREGHRRRGRRGAVRTGLAVVAVLLFSVPCWSSRCFRLGRIQMCKLYEVRLRCRGSAASESSDLRSEASTAKQQHLRTQNSHVNNVFAKC